MTTLRRTPAALRRTAGGLGRAIAGTTAVLVLAGCGAASPTSSTSSTSQPPETGASTEPYRAPAGGRPTPAATSDTTPTSWGPTEGEVARAAELVEELPVAEQAATVLMPGFWGYSASDPEPAEMAANEDMHGVGSALEAVERRGFSSFFLRPEVIADATQVAALAGALQEAAGELPAAAGELPALLSIDQEGGTVQRLTVGVETIPSASYIGSTGDRDYARQVAVDNGAALAELGVTMVMAPVAGVDPDGTSALGSRVYGSDPGLVARMVASTLRGYLDAGVLPVVKHFPGLASVEGDSHVTLPAQVRPVEELRRTDLRPFEKAIEVGAPVIMTGHVEVQALDPGVPSSLSPEVVQGLLRDDMGFEGVAVTDSQGMGPVHAVHGSAEGAVLSLLAGNDLVLNSPQPRQALDAVQEAVAEGRLSEERLAEAATRVLALRLYLQRLQETAGSGAGSGG